MGSASSVEEKNKKITTYHNDISIIQQNVVNKANYFLRVIRERGYNDKDAICGRIIWQNYDELLNVLPITNINNTRYKAGLPPSNQKDFPQLEKAKNVFCLNIATLYAKKINLLNNILTEMPKCSQMEAAVYSNLAGKLRSENADNEKWLTIHQKLENFNKDIKKRYELIFNQLEIIRTAQTIPEIDRVARTVNSVLTQSNNVCRNYEHDLIMYSSKSAQASPRPNKPLPVVPTSEVPTSEVPTSEVPSPRASPIAQGSVREKQ